MNATYVQRLRIKFSKSGPTRYIGHLDVARTWERALNRAKIPVDYSQGFNRRPKMQFATATPLGATSEAEFVDIWLREVLDPEQARAQIMSRMAPGIDVLDLYEVPLTGPALQTLTRETAFVATIPADLVSYDTLQERVAELLASESVMRQRTVKKKVRTYDLRPLVKDLQLAPGPDGAHLLTMRLTLEPSRTGRTDEVMKQLGLDPLDARVHRTELWLESDLA